MSTVHPCNPPYGERLGDSRAPNSSLSRMREAFGHLRHRSIYILTSYPRFEHIFGRKAGPQAEAVQPVGLRLPTTSSQVRAAPSSGRRAREAG